METIVKHIHALLDLVVERLVQDEQAQDEQVTVLIQEGIDMVKIPIEKWAVQQRQSRNSPRLFATANASPSMKHNYQPTTGEAATAVDGNLGQLPPNSPYTLNYSSAAKWLRNWLQ